MERLAATSPGPPPSRSDGRVLADELVDIYGSPLWERLSEKDRVELNRRITAWRLSVLVYGEQGAMLACSQLVDTVAGADAKFFQATQVMDEARHNEVLERYIQQRLGGLHYPMPENERFLFDVDPHGLALVHQDHRAAAGGGDLRGLACSG